MFPCKEHDKGKYCGFFKIWIWNGVLRRQWGYWSVQISCMTVYGKCRGDRSLGMCLDQIIFLLTLTIKVMIQWFCKGLWNAKIKGATDPRNIMISSIFGSDVIIFVHFRFYYLSELSECSHRLSFWIITIPNSLNQPICLDKNYMHGCPYSQHCFVFLNLYPTIDPFHRIPGTHIQSVFWFNQRSLIWFPQAKPALILIVSEHCFFNHSTFMWNSHVAPLSRFKMSQHG